MDSIRAFFRVPRLLILFVVTSAAIALAVSQAPEKTAPSRPAGAGRAAAREAVRLNNLGVAYMNQQRFDHALKSFERAYALNRRLTLARLNQGIALLNKQNLEAAQAALAEAAEKMPENPRAWYNLGLLYKSQGRAENAIDSFRHAARLVPGDADTRYFLGMLYSQVQNYAEAIAAFEQALALNPLHASAEFGLGRAWQRKGDTEQARKHLARFQQITEAKLGAPMSLSYGDQGRLSLAEQILPQAGAAPPAIPVHFVASTEKAGLSAGGGPGALSAAAGVCVFDYDGDGRPDIFLVSALAGGSSALFRNLGDGRFENVTRTAKLDLPGPGLGCAAADYDNDGHTDLAVAFADGVRLFRNDGKSGFSDVTEAAGIRRDAHPVSVNFVDYDHDGDLDLFVVRGEAPGSASGNSSGALRAQLWRNNGNGTFTDWSEPAGLNAVGPAIGIFAVDFNNDRATDLVVTGSGRAPLLLLNQREGPFKRVPAWDPEKENLPPVVGGIAFDFDKDGWMDLAFTHDGAPGLTLWRNVQGQRLERVPLPDLGWTSGRGLAALDYDNDGWLDLVAVGEAQAGGEVRLLRNRGRAGFADVTKDVALAHLPLVHPQAIVTGDFAGSGATDLLISQLGGAPLLLRNAGGNRNASLRLALKSLADNKDAVGTKVELFSGDLYQKWEVQAASGYLGQSAPGILAGLGSAHEADIVRLLWPTGVPQDELQLPAGKTQTISELDRRGSSCPVLWVWNGRKYEFIADLIGPGIVGHWVAPGERNVADPTEYLKVDGSRVRLRNGKISMRVAEPMEEVVFLDQVRLLAVDHPSGVLVYPNERFMSAPPFPQFQVVASRGAHPPLGAWDDRGRDILPELRARDRRYVTGFELDSFHGFAKMHSIELDLGDWNPAAPLRLLMRGLTDYFTATSMYAAHQAGVTAVAPYVEAQDAAGRWVRVLDDMGFPAGLARTMVADLSGRLPAGTRRIRITTNLVLYWDQILVDNTPEDQPTRVTEVPLAQARLRFLGYPREVQVSLPADLAYDYQQVSPTGPFEAQAGSYTRYGEVLPLLRKADDRFVILSSGDEVALEFDPARLPPLPRGWSRDYFFFADGFEKDRDFYAANGDTVSPLPYHAMKAYPYPEAAPYPNAADALDYQLNYNTRLRSGTAPSFRYRFPASPRSPQKSSGETTQR